MGAGAVLALLPARPGAAAGLRALAGAAGIGLIVLALFIHTPVTPFPGWFAALPVAGAALLMLSGHASPTGRLLSMRPMLWIGWISYPLYLVHWPVIQLMRAALPEVGPGHRWAGFAVAIFLAWLIWALVERPVRSGALLRRPRPLLLGTAAATGLLAVTALAGVVTQGFPARLPVEARAVLAYAEDRPVAFDGCAFSARSPGAAPCPLGVPSQPPRVAVIGDSHAQALAGAFDLWLKEGRMAGELWFQSGCKPVVGATDRDCPGFLDAVNRKAGALRQKLEGLVDAHPQVFESVRGQGLMLGLKCKAPVADVVKAGYAAEVITVPAADNVARLLPPLTLTEEEIAEAIARLDKAATAVEEAGA